MTEVKNAERHLSKLDSKYMGRLTGGLGSPKVWHLLNNLGAQSKVYLEIGSFMGASLMATLEGNDHLTAYTCDDFRLKPTIRNHFFQNTKHYVFKFFEQDCFTIDRSQILPVDLYFFDGEHTYEAQYKALTYFIDCMDDECTFIVDDWTMKPVQEGTWDAINDLGLIVKECTIVGEGKIKDRDGWWSGLGIFKLKK